MSMQQLREHKAELARQANALLAEKGAQVWSKDDQVKFDDMASQMDRVESQILAHQKMLEAQAETSGADAAEFRGDPKEREAKDSAVRKLFAKFLRGGVSAMQPGEFQQIRNTLSTTTGSQGGFSVQTDVARELIDSLKTYQGMRQEANVFTTSTGAPMSFPTSDGTSEVGEWVAENTTAAAADPVFGTVALNTFKSGSKSIAIPIELLQDTEIDMVAFINKRIRDRIGRIQNTGYTVGTGTGQPNGLVTAASTGKTGLTGQTLTIIYDDLVDLIDSIDQAYQDASSSLCFMGSQSIRKVVRKIKDGSGRPIWTPSYDAGIAGGYRDQLLGYDFCVNNDFAVPAANAKSLAFGDLKRYYIRDAMDLTILRFEDSAFMLKGQVGFVAWMRTGGNLTDTGAVKLYAHSAT